MTALVLCVASHRRLRTPESRRLGIGPKCLADHVAALAVLAGAQPPRVPRAAAPPVHGPDVHVGQITIEEAIDDDDPADRS